MSRATVPVEDTIFREYYDSESLDRQCNVGLCNAPVCSVQTKRSCHWSDELNRRKIVAYSFYAKDKNSSLMKVGWLTP